MRSSLLAALPIVAVAGIAAWSAGLPAPAVSSASLAPVPVSDGSGAVTVSVTVPAQRAVVIGDDGTVKMVVSNSSKPADPMFFKGSLSGERLEGCDSCMQAYRAIESHIQDGKIGVAYGD